MCGKIQTVHVTQQYVSVYVRRLIVGKVWFM